MARCKLNVFFGLLKESTSSFGSPIVDRFLFGICAVAQKMNYVITIVVTRKGGTLVRNHKLDNRHQKEKHILVLQSTRICGGARETPPPPTHKLLLYYSASLYVN